MPDYNPDVLKRYANALYVQAAIEIVIYTSLGLLVGYVTMSALPTTKRAENKVVYQPSAQLGTIPAAIQTDTYHDRDNPFQYFPLAIGGFLGLLIGVVRSYSLRVKAQMILCQVAIEENTNRRVPAKY